MWGYIIGGLVLLGVSMSLILFKYFVRKEPSKEVKDKNKNIIKQPKMYLWIGIIGTVFVILLAVLIILNHFDKIKLFNKENLLILLALIPFLSLTVYITMISANWKIEINENGFTYRNLWGVKKNYEFKDISMDYKSASLRLYKEKKQIVNISYLQSNIKALTDAESNYRKTQKISKKQKS